MANLFQPIIPSHLALPRADAGKRDAVFPLHRVALFLVAVLLYAHPDSARSATGGCSEPTSAVPAGTEAPEQQGLKAFIDPATGELISEPIATQPAQAPAKVVDQPELPVEVRPDGTLVLDLTANPVNELRVEKVDGKLIDCHREVSAQPGKNDAGQHDSGTDPAGPDPHDER